MTTIDNITVHTTTTAPMPNMGERLITQRFKQPARVAHICVPATPWVNVTANAAPQYREVLLAVLDAAAKTALNKALNSFSQWPSTLPAAYWTETALLDSVTASSSEWMSKDEIEAAWRASVTRRLWVTRPDYTVNQAFRKAVAHFEALILKLAGKSSTYTSGDLDLMLAKLNEADLGTELGSFICRRVEAMKNKPVTEIECDLL
jgi:hypothetical protein